MKINKVIEMTKKINTLESLRKDLKNIGIQKGDCVIVHSSLSSIGYVSGGEITVINALLDIITKEGTLIMPAHSGDYSNPEDWGNPPVPKEWIPIIKETMPAFDKDVTPTLGMGIIAENFRKFKGVLRSNHPVVSFTAHGKEAEEILKESSLEYSLGEKSPLAKMYEKDAKILLIGAGYNSTTAFHLAEYRAKKYKIVEQESPVKINGERKWVKYKDIEFKTEVFENIGLKFEEKENVIISNIGQAESRLFSFRDAVNFAVEYLNKMDI